jgi:SAM-dependent methyltransferase
VSEQRTWVELVRADPEFSNRYLERFRGLAASGQDIVGEGRLVDAMVPRGSRILDAGCGAGRISGFLAGVGHEVIGVDVDPALIEAARSGYPPPPDGPRWLVADLATLDLAGAGLFDAVVCAGNVLPYVATGARREVLARLRAHLAPQGRAAIGFAAGRGYDFTDFRADARRAGFAEELLLATWDLRPFTPDSDFLVALLRQG